MTDTGTDRARWLALYVLCAGALMIVIDATIVNVALPTIQKDLRFSQSDLAWVVNAYLIAFGGLLLLAGRVGDLIGQRRVFLIGLTIFTLASLLCALSQSKGLLIGARFVQGIGGALSSAVVLGMIVTMFPEPREQAKAIGIYGFVASAGGSIGLLLGGVLTQAINWHWIFFVNLPIGLATGFFALRLVEDRPGIGFAAGADVPGAGLLTAGLMLGVYAILQVGAHGWGSTQTLVLGAVSLALLAAFVARQARVENPLMPLRLFRSRNVSGANIVMALEVVGMFGMFFLGALYLQRVLGYDALKVGLAFLPTTIVMGTMSLRVAGPADAALRRARVADREPAVHHRGARAVRPDARRGELRLGHPAGHAADRPRRRSRLPVADDARDVGRHAERRRPRFGSRQHQRAGRRRDRSRGARHARLAAHQRPPRRGGVQQRRAQLGLPPGLPHRRCARHGRAADRGARAAPRRSARRALAGGRARAEHGRRVLTGTRPAPRCPRTAAGARPGAARRAVLAPAAGG